MSSEGGLALEKPFISMVGRKYHQLISQKKSKVGIKRGKHVMIDKDLGVGNDCKRLPHGSTHMK